MGVIAASALALGATACGGASKSAGSGGGTGSGSANSSVTSGSGSGGGSTSKPLVMLDSEVAPSLDNDGVAAADPALQQALENIREPLVTYPTTDDGGILKPSYTVAPNGFKPDLAASYSKKGLVWTFKLRKGVRSCAGNELTADDVVYTFGRAKSVSGAAPVAWFLGNVGGVFGPEAVAPKAPGSAKQLHGEVKKVDRYTVQFKQTGPNDLFPRILTIFPLYIFDSKAMKQNATAQDPWSHKYTDTKDAPGFGPYCLTKWTKGSEINLKSNPKYWRGQPKYTNIVLRQVPSDSDRVAAITSGQADVVTALTPKEFQQIGKSGQATVYTWQNTRVLGLGINYAYPPFKSPQGTLIRQAIAYAMPYQDIVNNDYLGEAKKWNGLIESNFYGFNPITTYNTDLAKAKALMAQAGYPGGKGLPKSQAFTLNYVAERATLLEPIANRIKSSLAQIGIPIQLAPISQAEENTRELTKFDMGMFLRDYNRPLGPDVGYATLLWYVSAKGHGLEPSVNYASTAVDTEFGKSQATTGANRLAALGAIQTQVMKDLPLVPMVEVSSQLAVRKGITGWLGTPYDLVNYWYFK